MRNSSDFVAWICVVPGQQWDFLILSLKSPGTSEVRRELVRELTISTVTSCIVQLCQGCYSSLLTWEIDNDSYKKKIPDKNSGFKNLEKSGRVATLMCAKITHEYSKIIFFFFLTLGLKR